MNRIYVTKRKGFDVEAINLKHEIEENLKISNIDNIKIYNRYDVQGLDGEDFEKSLNVIFSEPMVDDLRLEEHDTNGEKIVIEYLAGQYDQRADSAEQCVRIFTGKDNIKVRCAREIVFEGNISKDDVLRIKTYLINPVDQREGQLEKPETLDEVFSNVGEVPTEEGFINMSEEELQNFLEERSMAMDFNDLKLCQEYFKSKEKRNPTETELKVLDTYWSDHCRHTTFMTNLQEISIEDGFLKAEVEMELNKYKESRDFVYGKDSTRDNTMMDMATIAMKEMRKKGILEDLEVSDEINACSIEIDVETVDFEGKEAVEKWLLMFKNETHNHPTEIEPFGGAATCLGGAIRDPLSGRSYVYQAMRITGSADPRTPVENTLKGKLPQIKITKEAAHGYSSYGNQIGLPAGHVEEVYHEDFVAKRMEVGAVIGAAPRENVKRIAPVKDDIVILVGGKTGRDGCGGATGSSREHDISSIEDCSAEVQKGNPVEERKIQRLFRNKEVAMLIKKCNDFGAGGVSVAIGELADGLNIELDNVPKKYEGLTGTELAISESQERMAVVVEPKDAQRFIDLCHSENLEATIVAKVTDKNRLVMEFKGQKIVDLDREFLDSSGAKRSQKVVISNPDKDSNPFELDIKRDSLKNMMKTVVSDINVASQKGLTEKFDSSIGTISVLSPWGGETAMTPTEAMAGLIPVEGKYSKTSSLMSHGYNPFISKWSPFHGAFYAVVESVSKIVAMGGSREKIRLSFQEYFEKLGTNEESWGKPVSALMGALKVQRELEIPAIGGKDSMSGTFLDINVPPTLISFAVTVENAENIISPEFKKAQSPVIYLNTSIASNNLLDLDEFKKNMDLVTKLIHQKKVISAHTVKTGGVLEALSKMSFGNKIGLSILANIEELCNKRAYGSLILELKDIEDVREFEGYNHIVLGSTVENKFSYKGEEVLIDELIETFEKPLEKIFPTWNGKNKETLNDFKYEKRHSVAPKIKVEKPKVLITAFPGTNCEYDSKRAFEEAGGEGNILVFRNRTIKDIEESVLEMEKAIRNTNILMIPGGFSAGDEPEGSGKFIGTVLRNPRIQDAIEELLEERDGLIMGICNGFQALIKLGLLPYGKFKEMTKEDATLTYNQIGRHVSQMVRTKIVSVNSPWLSNVEVGDVHRIPVSHGEGRFMAPTKLIEELRAKGQIITQYVDEKSNITMEVPHNPNGSMQAIEGIVSPDGRIIGKMAHSERIGSNVHKNISGNLNQQLFKSGIDYFKL